MSSSGGSDFSSEDEELAVVSLGKGSNGGGIILGGIVESETPTFGLGVAENWRHDGRQIEIVSRSELGNTVLAHDLIGGYSA